MNGEKKSRLKVLFKYNKGTPLNINCKRIKLKRTLKK